MASIPTYSDKPEFWEASVSRSRDFVIAANSSPEFMALVKRYGPGDVSEHAKVRGEDKTAADFLLPSHIKAARIQHVSLIVQIRTAALAVTDKPTLVKFFRCAPEKMKMYFLANKALPYEFLAEIVRKNPVSWAVTAGLAHPRHAALLLQDFGPAIEARRADAPDLVEHLHYLTKVVYANVS